MASAYCGDCGETQLANRPIIDNANRTNHEPNFFMALSPVRIAVAVGNQPVQPQPRVA